MEAIVGFVIGYWVGTQEGRDGVKRALDSWSAISRSEEFRSLVSGAVSLAGATLQQGLSSKGGGIAASFAGAITEKATEKLSGRTQLKAV